ncbi:hypothetical protein [Nitratifractor sp.]
MKRGTARRWAITTAILLHGCGEHPYVKLYDPELPKHPPACMTLHMDPADPPVEKKLRSLYRFQPDCLYHLEVGTKERIVCHSAYNAPAKATTAFPSSYLRMDLYRGKRIVYSYYIDLTSPADADDAETAFDRLRDDLHLR